MSILLPRKSYLLHGALRLHVMQKDLEVMRTREEQYNDPRFVKELQHERHVATGAKICVYIEEKPTGLPEGSSQTVGVYSGHWSTPNWSHEVKRYVSVEAMERAIIEAERRAEQRVRAEMSVGYIFHNPDTGTEILPYHPVESGECLDAQDIRQATAEVLREELVSTWEEMANEYREREERGEGSLKDSERLDWLGEDRRGLASHASMGTYVTTESGETYVNEDIRAAIDEARGKK